MTEIKKADMIPTVKCIISPTSIYTTSLFKKAANKGKGILFKWSWVFHLQLKFTAVKTITEYTSGLTS